MELSRIIDEFPDETSCRRAFKQFRDTQGVVCRKCGSTDHYWQATIEQYQCKKCGTRTTLRSGTVMHASNLPFRYWFIAMYLLTRSRESYSVLEVQKQIGHKFYEPIWYMMQKIRAAIEKGENKKFNEKVLCFREDFFDEFLLAEEENREISEPREEECRLKKGVA